MNIWRLIGVGFLSLVMSGCSSWQVSDDYKDTLKELVRSTTSCMVTDLVQKDLATIPVYEVENDICHRINLHEDSDGQYYTNPNCQDGRFDYRRTHYIDFCKELATPYRDRLGNPAAWSGDHSRYWTLPRSAGLSLSTLKIRHNHYPFMTRVHYKSVAVREQHETSRGEITTLKGLGQCDLEMRIYKKSPTAEGLKPLILIHGGAWRFRGTAYTALESEVSHLTERGFVVFAPFYRLVGQADGNYECNNASWPEILSDVEDALRWVQENGGEYGALAGKSYLLGGSAGGHLATWLSVNHPDEIARTLLFYPPTDFQHYVHQAQQSSDRLKGENYMKGYLGVDDLDMLSLDAPSLLANSFPIKVVAEPQAFPPMAMIHGLKDMLVPSDQSVRLCNAINGDIENGPAQNVGGDVSQGEYSKHYSCGDDGMLYLINEGDHALDVCVDGIECPAGSKPSQKAVSAAMKHLFDWLAEEGDEQ